MGVTRLKRKARRNKRTAAIRKRKMKQVNFQPVIKKIDPEEAKAAFEAKKKPVVKEKDTAKKAAGKATVTKPKAEAPAEKITEENTAPEAATGDQEPADPDKEA